MSSPKQALQIAALSFSETPTTLRRLHPYAWTPLPASLYTKQRTPRFQVILMKGGYLGGIQLRSSARQYCEATLRRQWLVPSPTLSTPVPWCSTILAVGTYSLPSFNLSCHSITPRTSTSSAPFLHHLRPPTPGTKLDSWLSI
jgi:hypothetical protein